MDVREENITPAKAESYLNRNTSNRKLRDGVVERYATDMQGGKWTECPEPISFYENGDVADGQHRLWAIVESATPQKFLVVRNLSREAGLNLNTGLTRTLVDNARISGADHNISNEIVAVARAMDEGERQGRGRSNSAKLALVEKHRAAVDWAVTNGPKGRHIRNTITLAAIARAWYKEENKDRLRRFCDVLTTGMSDGEMDSAAVALRNYLLAKRTDVSNKAFWRDSFLKAMNAINYFMQQKRLMVIKAVGDEVYPLGKPIAKTKRAKK